MAKLNTMAASIIKHIMLFGPPKSGKSLWAGKLAKYKNIIWFDLERGHSVLFQLPQEFQEKIEVIIIPDTAGTPMAIETMLKVIKGTKVTICEKHGKVTCPLCNVANSKEPGSAPGIVVELNALDSDTLVVVDSLTQLTMSAISRIKLKQPNPDDYKFEFDDWGQLKILMETFCSYVQAAPFNILCISHEDEVDMVDKTKKLVPVAGSSKFSRNVAKYFDEVVYSRVVNGKHKLASSTTTDNNILTGSRNNVDLGKQEIPDLITLWEVKA